MCSWLKGRAKLPTSGFALLFFILFLIDPARLPAQEQHPSVARLSFVSGAVTYSRGDDPDEWDDAIENVPVTIGDRIYAPQDARAEIQLSSGNFIRIAPRSYLSTLNLSEDIKQFYLGEGSAAFTIKRLQSDEVIEIDTPNVSVTLDEPGRYRIVVDENGNSRITARSGRATVAANGRQITVEKSELAVYGLDSPRYDLAGLPSIDAFDRWVSERDDRFARAYPEAYRYASEDIVGVEELAGYGQWENIPEYGYAWTPSGVAAGWMPFSDGRWYWQDPWGWTWISSQRWGWATSHYGRWTPYRSRWYWVPVRPRTRVRYAPACVEFVRVRDYVGWFPLHPRDRHIPWWERRDRRYVDRSVSYFNHSHVTVINNNYFISGRPVRRQIVRDTVVLQEARTARFADSLPIPNRSSLRLASESGVRRGHQPPVTIVNRTLVVRTAPPAPPRTFQEKLPEIQKNQGMPVEPVRLVSTRQDDRAQAQRTRIRPAAEAERGDFAPRNPGATSGPAPQPVTEARGKRLATRDNPMLTQQSDERAPRAPAPLQPAQPPQSSPTQGTAGKPSAPKTAEDRERQRQRESEAQQQEIDRRKQEQRNDLERKLQAQKQQEERKAQQREDQPRREAKPQGPSPEQQRLEEIERRQAQQQEQERRQQLRQQQLQERQTQQQKQQELERRQQIQQQEQERKARVQQQQQDQAQREQLRQQQLQEREGREQQRQELQRRQPQPQEREIQQAPRPQEPERRQQQFRQPQAPERQIQQQQQQPRQPGQF